MGEYRVRFGFRGNAFSVLSAVFFSVWLLLSAGAAAAADGCVGCHEKYERFENRHEAMNRGCEACHSVPHDLTTNSFPQGSRPFGLISEVPELCYTCHDKKQYEFASPHPAMQKGCTACHNPHGSSQPKLMSRPDPDLCFDCHDPADYNKAVLHQPMTEGCLKCHAPHGSASGKLLKAPPGDICYSCHQAESFTGQVGHKTPETPCQACHSPHSSDVEGLLVKEIKDLCVECHKRPPQSNQHEPVAEGKCDTCHLPHASNARHNLVADAPALCFTCHANHTTKANVHQPLEEGKCFACHNAHQSGQPFQLKEPVQVLCFRCHDRKLITGAYVHGPAAAGACAICHSAHESDEPHLLVTKVNETCFNCHMDKAEDMQKAFLHKPAAESCANCHSPHASDFPFQLKAKKERDLCELCHDDKVKLAATAKNKHGALKGERQCLGCHNPHGSDFPRLLNAKPMDLCFGCHNKPLKREEDGTEIMDIKTKIESSKILHGPIKQADCSSCHNTHGSDNFRMLRKYFPPKFYAPYDPKNYGLCFNCHANTLVETRVTDTLTGFRNGKQNLHYVHVHKQVKGRTCRACHDAHGTNNPRHIRDGVPFGGWQLPINYTKTETGGRCAPGCHQEFGYDRERRVRNRR